MGNHQKIAVIGLGSMGHGIAQACISAGHETHGFDVVPERVEQLQREGGARGELSDVAETVDTVIIVVLNAAQTEAVLFGEDGIANKLRNGACIIACATVPPEFAIRMEAQCAKLGLHYLDAPISGGAAKAAMGSLSVMAAGTDEAFDAAQVALDTISETVFRLGDKAGPGSAMKAVNQLLAGVHIATMAEALTFGMTQGITPAKFLDVIKQCAGTSWMLENRAPHIVGGDYTPKSQVNIWPKDLGIVLDVAKSAGFEAPIAETALAQFKAAAEMGFGHIDDSAVAKVYAQQAGLTLPEPKK
ncbi:MAG: L-threonate dehydrogenase [Pseudomonadota bacterium]